MSREKKTISVDRRLFDEFIEKSYELELAQAVAKIGSWRLRASREEGFALKWTAQAYRIFGIPENTPMDYSAFLAHVHPEDRDAVDTAWKAAMEGAEYEIEHRIVRTDGTVRWVSERAELSFENGKFESAVGTVQDVTDRWTSDERLRLIQRVFDHTQEGIIITDAEGVILQVNPSFERVTGYSLEEVVGHNPKILKSSRQDAEFYREMWEALARDGSWRGEIWNQRKNGETYPEILGISAMKNRKGAVTHYVGIFSDVSQIREHEEKLLKITLYDPLTNLPNRNLFLERLRAAMTRAYRNRGTLAVCYVDFDEFKSVNDLHGHAVGDRLIVEVGKRISSILRANDVVARIGGDEFAILLQWIGGAKEASIFGQRMLAELAKPFTVDGRRIEISVSMGVTLYPEDSQEADQLVRHADQAMYVAKEGGKGQIQFFDTKHHQLVRSRSETFNRIRKGMEKGEFELHYQPKVHLGEGGLAGFEALARWKIDGEFFSPAKFIPIIEEDVSLSVEFGEWVIRTALRQMSAWQSENVGFGTVAVNVSALHLQKPGFVDSLSEILRDFPEIDPASLELELVETAALQHLEETSETITRCLSLGVSFAIDDFGTGYSSLSYLKRLRASTLKIDQGFVRDLLDNPDDLTIIEGVLGLAKAFGKSTVAEGVETLGQAEILNAMGCEIAQGYAIAKPMEPASVPHWIVSHRERTFSFRKLSTPLPFRTMCECMDIIRAKECVSAWGIRIEAQFQKRQFSTIEHASACAFGKWFENQGKQKYGQYPWYPEIGSLHIRMHESAVRASECLADGRMEAYERERGEFEVSETELLNLLGSVFYERCGQ